MTNLAYGQYCGLARALEIVGKPWALLVVRDLAVGPKSFDDLHRGLPRLPARVLTARLGELEAGGIVRQVASVGSPAGYELTEYGSELEDVILQLGRWGAKILGGPRREEVITTDSMLTALRATFRPEAARRLRVSYELRLGEIVIHARIDRGALEAGEGPLDDADLVIEAGPALKALMAGEMSPREAIETGSIRLKTGNVSCTEDPGLLAWFAEIFHIPPPHLHRSGTSQPARLPAGHQSRVAAV
jgi:DNA-binding HxlR family transcriptional regulator/putative sterol carrier protein